jgi:hypothetical protein
VFDSPSAQTTEPLFSAQPTRKNKSSQLLLPYIFKDVALRVQVSVPHEAAFEEGVIAVDSAGNPSAPATL